jgi:hypothetical protein
MKLYQLAILLVLTITMTSCTPKDQVTKWYNEIANNNVFDTDSRNVEVDVFATVPEQTRQARRTVFDLSPRGQEAYIKTFEAMLPGEELRRQLAAPIVETPEMNTADRSRLSFILHRTLFFG